MADPLGRGGLPVGPRHRHELVGDQTPGKLELTEYGKPATARRHHHRSDLRYARALDERPRLAESRYGVWCRIQRNFDAGPQKPFGGGRKCRIVGRACVVAAHHLTAGPQRERRRDARTRETYDEIWTARERRTRLCRPALSHELTADRR